MSVTLKQNLPISAIEIDDNFIKLCQIEEKKGKKILKLSLTKLKPPSQTSTEIKKIIKEAKIRKHSLIIVIPREQVIMRFLRLPSTDESELSGMLELQVRQQVPYPKEDMVIDYIILDRFSDGSSLVMFTAARKETIYRHTRLFEELEHRPQIATLSSLGVVNWYNCVAGKESQQPVLLLDIDYNYVEAMLVQDSKLLFTRSISVSDDKDSLISELARTMQSIQKEVIPAGITKFVLTGGINKFEGLADLLKDRFSIPVDSVSHLGSLTLQDASSYNKYKDENISVSSVIGTALSRNKMLVNLIPADVMNKWESKEKRMYLVRSLAMIGGIFILLVLAHISEARKAGAYARFLDTELRKTQGEVNRLQDMTKRLEFIRQELNKKQALLNIISALYTITPSSIRLLDFIYEEQDKVSIWGQAQAMSEVFELSNKLEKQQYFKGVKIKYVSEKKLPGAESRVDFELLCLLN